jgi:hypothetical protein
MGHCLMAGEEARSAAADADPVGEQRRGFGPEHLANAHEIEAELRAALAKAEAAGEAEDGPSARSEGDGPKKAASSAAPDGVGEVAETRAEPKADDFDAEWNRRQQQEYARARSATAHSGPSAFFARGDARIHSDA